jgi:chemotaxis protein methyltransferase CheR
MNLIEEHMLERFKKLVTGFIGLSINNGDNETFRKALEYQMKSRDIEDPEKYLSFLESDTGESIQAWRDIIIAITTGESYFFRDKGLFYLLRNTLLPELIKANGAERNLRIWSAGCAAGEEPYSIAILIEMILPDFAEWNISITGTDINEISLKKGERGIYSQWSFRMVDKSIQEKYFKKHRDGWEINDGIRKMVTFRYGNLIDDSFFQPQSQAGNMDIIICRNVFIYFDKSAVSSTINKFERILNPGGYLITGHAELSGHDLPGMNQLLFPEAVIFQKNSLPGLKKDLLSGLSYHNEEIKNNMLNRAYNTGEPVKQMMQIKSSDITKKVSTEEKDDYDSILQKAKEYANSGDYENALSFIQTGMSVYPYSADLNFLMAQIEEAKGNINEAKNLFRKAIYLDSAFVAAYCELASIYEQGNEMQRAGKARVTAVEFLKSLPPQSNVKPYNITAGELIKYILYLTTGGDDPDKSAAAVERSA